MLRSLLTSIFACVATVSFACVPAPNQKLDTFLNSEVLIAVADVKSATAQAYANGGSCFTVKYSTTELIKGPLEQNFSIVTCSEDFSVEELLSSPGHNALGFVVGASVIVGVVREGPAEGKLRYFTPSCWGPFHHRLDTLSLEKRNHIFQLLSEKIEQWNKMTLMP